METRRKRERTVDFKHACERKANFFVDEIYARRALEIYVRSFGDFFCLFVWLFTYFSGILTTQEDSLTDRQVQGAVQCIQFATEHYPVRIALYLKLEITMMSYAQTVGPILSCREA